jgi:hypothetical protein
MDEVAKKTMALEVVDTPELVEQYGAMLKELGLTTAAKRLDSARRLTIAYAKYGHVTDEAIFKFNEKLKKESMMRLSGGYGQYNQLRFTRIADYGKIPPVAALARLREAVHDNVFDFFEVADIQSVKEVPDPIIFGRIEGCTDRFYVAQWDDDVTIEEIVGGTDATPQGPVEGR